MTVLTFSVERTLKGAIGDTVNVRTWRSGSSCGIEASVGQSVGLFLMRDGRAWTGNLCRQVEPADLLAVTSLPAPDWRGAPAMFVGGNFGPARTIALDAEGRTLAYGVGGGATTLLSMCPGERVLAEIAQVRTDDRQRATYEIAIREPTSLRLVRRQRLKLPGWRFATGLVCDNAHASSVVVFASWAGDGSHKAALYRIGLDRMRAIWQGTGFLSSLDRRRAYLREGAGTDRVLVVDLRTTRAEAILRLPLGPSLVPNGRDTRLAGLTYRLGQESRIFLVDLRTRPPKVRSVGLAAPEVFGQVLWLPSGRLLFVPSGGPETVRVLDLGLRTLARFRFTAGDPIVRGSTVFGLAGRASLISAELPDGPRRVVRRLPGRAHVLVSATG